MTHAALAAVLTVIESHQVTSHDTCCLAAVLTVIESHQVTSHDTCCPSCSTNCYRITSSYISWYMLPSCSTNCNRITSSYITWHMLPSCSTNCYRITSSYITALRQLLLRTLTFIYTPYAMTNWKETANYKAQSGQKTISHIINSCLLTKLKTGLQFLHEANDDDIQ